MVKVTTLVKVNIDVHAGEIKLLVAESVHYGRARASQHHANLPAVIQRAALQPAEQCKSTKMQRKNEHAPQACNNVIQSFIVAHLEIRRTLQYVTALATNKQTKTSWMTGLAHSRSSINRGGARCAVTK